MRTRMYWLLAVFVLGVGGFAAFSWTHGQDPTPVSKAITLPATDVPPPLVPPQAPPPSDAVGNRVAQENPLHEQFKLDAQRGAEWLAKQNGVDGRFVHGNYVVQNKPMLGDHALRQLGAAFALARAARFTREADHAAVATQAILRYLDDTALDPRDPQVRFVKTPPISANRLGATALLVLAIHELPAPQDDLLEKAEQLCGYLRRQQLPDGSLQYLDNPTDAAEEADGVNQYPGLALAALMRSQERRPAPWKTEAVRKALGYYRTWWSTHKNPTFVPAQTAAFAQAYLLTKEQPYADFVNEMNDWLVKLQYQQFDMQHPERLGGFPNWADGKPLATLPQVTCAAYAESLAEACRVARQAGDVQRFERYRSSCQLCLQFVSKLQYCEANTQHFQPWYRTTLLGGFHASPEDGNLRLDYNQHAVLALVQYLRYTL